MIERTYWAIPWRLLGGCYPLHPSMPKTRLKSLLEFGIDAFVDLTTPGEYGGGGPRRLSCYDHLLPPQVVYRNFPIPDFGVRAPEFYREIFTGLDELLVEGRLPLVHCYGGIGRTGTVIAGYLLHRNLLGPAEVAGYLRRVRRQDHSHGRVTAPSIDTQRRMVFEANGIDPEPFHELWLKPLASVGRNKASIPGLPRFCAGGFLPLFPRSSGRVFADVDGNVTVDSDGSRNGLPTRFF